MRTALALAPDAPAREVARAAADAADALRSALAKRIVGLNDIIDELLVVLFTQRHALLEGVPGLAKTLLVSSLSELLGLAFSRIQFTPDLMPSDVTGTEYLVQDPTTGDREFRFAPGPVFAHLVLADEINRAPPKTQAALMEAMEEQQVTSLGISRPLENPFIVLATQNPIEQEGTYPLPFAQLDRFMVRLALRYPSENDEARIARLATRAEPAALEPILDREAFLALRDGIRRMTVPPAVQQHAVQIVKATRPHDASAPGSIRERVAWGAGPRATQALVEGARARAALAGRTEATTADARALAPAVLRHRIVLGFAAEAEGVSTDEAIGDLLLAVPEPGVPAPRGLPLWRRLLALPSAGPLRTGSRRARA